jgi:hypothetical protein
VNFIQKIACFTGLWNKTQNSSTKQDDGRHKNHKQQCSLRKNCEPLRINSTDSKTVFDPPCQFSFGVCMASDATIEWIRVAHVQHPQSCSPSLSHAAFLGGRDMPGKNKLPVLYLINPNTSLPQHVLCLIIAPLLERPQNSYCNFRTRDHLTISLVIHTLPHAWFGLPEVYLLICEKGGWGKDIPSLVSFFK